MKRALLYTALGLALYGVFLVATVPAAWVYKWTAQRLGGAVVLTGISGSVWQGRAQSARFGDVQLEKLHWDLQPWALLLGRLNTGLEFNYQAQPGRIVVASRRIGGRWVLSEVALLLPARRFENLLRLPGAELGGVVDVKLADLTLEHGRIAAAAGVLRWDRAAVVRPVPAQLGGFELKLEPADAGTKGVLKDQGGPVQADGLLTLKEDGNYTLTASFVSRDLRQPAIAQGLQLFGQPGVDGRVQVNSKGVMPPLLPGAS